MVYVWDVQGVLKFAVPPSGLDKTMRLAWLRKFASGPTSRQGSVSVYFDTDRFKLRRRGITLQVCKTGRTRMQMIEVAPDRTEASSEPARWKVPVMSDRPDLGLARHTALAPWVTRRLEHRLHPVFETTVRRTVVPLRVGTSLIEFALERGHIRSADRREPVSEIELQLKQGTTADLARIAGRLAQVLPIAYEGRSEAQRGYALSARKDGEPVTASPVTLPSTASLADAFTLIGLSCLHHMTGNRAAVRQRSSEGIHQMRVGLRRLRAAIAVFKDMVDGPQTEAIKAQLKWLTEQLGPARDFDVLVQNDVAAIQRERPDRPEIALLKSDLERRRSAGFDQARRAVTSERYRRIVFQIALWLLAGHWLHETAPLRARFRDRPVADFAAAVLDRLTGKIVRKVGRLEDLDTRRRHKLRIAVKKLRYSTGFFDSLFDGKKVARRRRRFEKSIRTLQDVLGRLSDIAVHQKLAGEYAHPKGRGRGRTDEAFAMGILAGRETAQDCLVLAAEAGARLSTAPRYWRRHQH